MQERTHDVFPFFLSVQGKKAVVAGGGRIAQRRVKTLRSFSFSLTVISPRLTEELMDLCLEGGFHWIQKELTGTEGELAGMLDGSFFVVAATDQREINQKIGAYCRRRDILVSVADAKVESTVYFPGIAQRGELIAGITAGGNNHRLAAEGTKQIKKALKEFEVGKDAPDRAAQDRRKT